MDEQVGGEGGRALEAFSTLLALETPLLLLRLLVLVRLRCSTVQLRQLAAVRSGTEQRTEAPSATAALQLKDTLKHSAL